MESDEVQELLSRWHRHIGTKGGLSRSADKRRTARKNAAKARKAKQEKRQKGAT